MPSPEPCALRTEADAVGGVEQAAGDAGGLTILPAPLGEDGVAQAAIQQAQPTQRTPRWPLFGSEESCTTEDVPWSF